MNSSVSDLRLSPELVDLVLKEVHSDTESRTPNLLCCALVDTAWLHLTRRYLFQSVLLVPSTPHRTPLDFLSFLHRTTGIAEHVRELVLHAQSANELDSPVEEQWTISLATLANLLSALPNIHSLKAARLIIGRDDLPPTAYTPVCLRRLILESLRAPTSSVGETYSSDLVSKCIPYADTLSLFSAIDILSVDRLSLFPDTRRFPMILPTEETIRQYLPFVPHPETVPRVWSFVMTRDVREGDSYLVRLLHHLGILRSLRALRIQVRMGLTPRDLVPVLAQSEDTLVHLTLNINCVESAEEDLHREFAVSVSHVCKPKPHILCQPGPPSRCSTSPASTLSALSSSIARFYPA